MTETTRRKSLVDLRNATVEGKLGLIAAKAGFQVVGLMNRAKEVTRVRGADIAASLNVSEGRVSQILNGDGNVHVATLARVLGACGYELVLSAQSIDGTGPVISGRRPGRRVESAKLSRRWDFFEQVYVSPSGVSAHVMAIAGEGHSAPTPLGSPRHVGAVSPGAATLWGESAAADLVGSMVEVEEVFAEIFEQSATVCEVVK